ncbi:hypothetical protein EV360DRAFT_28099, partial [Lentinula raphanica]
RDDFISYTPCTKLAKSSEATTPLRIVGFGTVRKVLQGPNGTVILTFDNVFHSPDVSYNLVSVSRMDKLGYQVLFGNG